ncbi:MAG: extensin family protein [Myxococcota bacterium]
MTRLCTAIILAASLILSGCSVTVTTEDGPRPDTAGVNYAGVPSEQGRIVVVPADTAADTERSSTDDVAGPAVEVPEDAGPGPEPEPEPVDPSGAPSDLNAGWIGGPCPDDLTCDYESGTCLMETEGFPEGHCSQPCELYCPDQDGAATTFCVGADDLGVQAQGGWCAMQCDFGMSPTGCRVGYHCASVARYGQPETVKFVCMPGEGEEVPLSDCMLELAERGVGFQVGQNPMDSPDGHPDLICDVNDPVWVDGTMAGVNFRYASETAEVKRIFAACELALAMHDTATLVATAGVTDIIHVGVYNCRVISGTSTLSEHAHANAIDISGFRRDDGTVWTVFDDWEDGVEEPITDAGDWLLWFVNELYVQWIFNIILTPEYNAAHDDHFHCDLTPGTHSLH